MPTSTRLALVLTLTVLCTSRAARAQDPYTDHPGPTGNRAVDTIVGELAAVVNANDAQGFLSFLERRATSAFEDAVPARGHIRVFRDFFLRTRGVEHYGYRTYDPPRPANEHVVILRGAKADGWWAFVLIMDDDEPARLAGLQFSPARRPSTLPPEPPLTLDTAVVELDRWLDRLVAADAFSGTVLLAADGRTVYERAAGEASKRFHVPNDIDTKFNLGSMNKMFTAVAICRLAEQGRLSLDDRLGDFVDETWLAPEIAQRIRIRHMLNHTSGLGSYFNDTFWESSRARFRNLDDYKPLIVGASLAFEPGTDWQYSNTAMFLLGVVIEKVTGASYFDHVRDTIFTPAGMTSTDSYEMDRPVENLAIGYIPEFDDAGAIVWRNNLYMHVIKGGPAGGGFSTVRDLLRFDRALRSATIISDSMRDELWRPRPEAHAPDYGYGFGVERGPLGRVVGHGGGFPGLNGQLDMYLDTGFTVAVLSNYDGGAGPVAQKIAELLGRVER